jgi:hypothetical protein
MESTSSFRRQQQGRKVPGDVVVVVVVHDKDQRPHEEAFYFVPPRPRYEKTLLGKQKGRRAYAKAKVMRQKSAFTSSA